MLGAKANRAAKQTSPEVHALGLFAFAQQVRALVSNGFMTQSASAVRVLFPVVRYPMLVSQSKCVARRYKHASTTPNLLPQAIGRKTPDKRNRSLLRMYHAYMLRTIASKDAFSTTFLKMPFRQQPEPHSYTSCASWLRGRAFYKKENPALSWAS
ncbi:MAG: hypothetical protein [Bacteriophage sp.]|nr:MAG: hypothetical protein [Bacteriophage sp.]